VYTRGDVYWGLRGRTISTRSGVPTLACPPQPCSVAIVRNTNGVMFSGIAGNAEEYYAATFEWLTALDRDLPEVLVERE